jgi:hypothetical protein
MNICVSSMNETISCHENVEQKKPFEFMLNTSAWLMRSFIIGSLQQILLRLPKKGRVGHVASMREMIYIYIYIYTHNLNHEICRKVLALET